MRLLLEGNSMPNVGHIPGTRDITICCDALGGPESSYRGDLTYLATNIGGIIGAISAALVLIPRFYQTKSQPFASY
ncbi:hypothetical protein O9992_12385 [Vibrio lentus]|nr:hypothetical protein [Vibrio lentus]